MIRVGLGDSSIRSKDMERKRALIVGSGRVHNAGLISALHFAEFDISLLSRPDEFIRPDERSASVTLYPLEAPLLSSLAQHVVKPPSLIICNAGFAHHRLLDAHDPERIATRIADIEDSVMAVACASVSLTWDEQGLLVFLGFAATFRDHPGYRRYARGRRAGYDVAQAFAVDAGGFRIAHIGLDGEDGDFDHAGLGAFVLALWRYRGKLPAWAFERRDLGNQLNRA
jgi:hypothetical protein